MTRLPEILLATTIAQRKLLELRSLRRSNPNHVPSGPHGGEFASGHGGSGGKHHAKRVRARKKKLEKWRKEAHQEIAELRVEHRKDRKILAKDQAKEWKAQRREHLKERNKLRREHTRDKTVKSERKSEHKALRQDQASERKSLHEDHVTDRQGMRQEQRESKIEVRDRWVSDIRYEFPKSKSGRPREGRSYGEANEMGRRTLDQVGDMQWDHDPGEQRQGFDLGEDRGLRQATSSGRRFSRLKTHKASSAEAILQHCLRRRGWTRQWRDGMLTGQQHLTLLRDVRQYGRAWLRHEAEGFFEAYGAKNVRGLIENRPMVEATGLTDGTREEGSPWGTPGILRRSSEIRSLGSHLLSPLKRFFDRARSFVHELAIAGLQALKGNEPLSAAEVATIDQAAKVQADYLDRFQREVIANPPVVLIDPADLQAQSTIVQRPPMSPGQFVARTEMYATSAHQAAQNTVRKTLRYRKGTAVDLVAEPPGGIGDVVMVAEPPGGGINVPIAYPPPAPGPIAQNMERRILGDPPTAHCVSGPDSSGEYKESCTLLAARGWQPMGTLPDIGDTPCGGRCYCHFEYRDENGIITVNGVAEIAPLKHKRVKPPVVQPIPNLPGAQVVAQPTHAEIKAEVDKWLAGKPSRIAITPPGTPPIVPGVRDPREGGGWKDASHQPMPGFELPAPSDAILKPGYEWGEEID